ncbi:helix-turn-helix domain-containing protein [Paraburkholderia sp. 40]|uniref:helix-turn-helix domain-containing protein n=1 Tax=unclassified Paraburkholderia TaxID=2615204 RepID=UPI003D20DB9D
MTATPDHTLNNRLGPRLARIRIERGYSQEYLARRLDVHVETISRFERGTALPTLPRLFELAEALAVPVAELLQGESTRPVDVGLEFAARLERLSIEDQTFMKKWFEEMCDHLGKSRRPRKKAG